MKRALILAGFMAVLAGGAGAGRANYVWHLEDDGSYDILYTSGGSCRHHMKAHPGDLLAKPGGLEQDPTGEGCN